MTTREPQKITPFSVHARPWRFLFLTLGLTWTFWFLAAAVDTVVPRLAITILHAVGGMMPVMVALGFILLGHDREFRRADWRDFWQRVFDFRRISLGWYAVIFLLIPVKSGLAALMDVLQGGWGIAPEALARFTEQPLLILPTLVFWLIFGPLPEELGWRGYALDGLQAGQSALSASLCVGGIWALWHLPLFFIEGSWQAENVGFGTQQFWFFMISLVVEAILYTWIYNNTQRSTLSAVLFHFVVNGFGELFELSARAEVYNFALSIVAALLVVGIWGAKTLSGRMKPPTHPSGQVGI